MYRLASQVIIYAGTEGRVHMALPVLDCGYGR